jgi:hypothetical protein
MQPVDLPATLAHLRSSVAAQAPWHTDRFARYVLVRIKCDIRTKMGLAFTRGEYALAVDQDPAPRRVRCEKFVTVWSRRNQVDTSVRAADVEWLPLTGGE